MPKINGNWLKSEGFKHDTPLDSIMGYYYIQIIEEAINLCTIIVPWVKTVVSVYQWEIVTH